MHAVLLVATLVALLSGPVLYAVAQRRPALLGFLDGFVLVSIAGLVLLEVLPDAFASGGWLSLAFLLAGLLGPTALEHGLTRARREAHLLALALAVLGLVLHSIGDGTALSGVGGSHRDDALALAIAIHSVPVGLVVWWLLYPVFGALLPGLALLAMGAATAAGFLFGIELGGLLGERGWAWFQALMSGSILHVIFGRPHLDETSEHHHTPPPFEGLGNLGALVLLAILAAAHEPDAAVPDLATIVLQLAVKAAPALLLAYLFVGALLWLGYWSRSQRLRPSLAAAAFALMLLASERLSVELTSAGLLALRTVWLAGLLALTGLPETSPARRTPTAALRLACVEAVDRHAAWILVGFGLAAAVDMQLAPQGPEAAMQVTVLEWASLAIVGGLYAAALLRRGLRALFADLFELRDPAVG
ncbi:hypothetical protein AAG565_13325 [Fontimonas sp. SYSU GA230001]|uniref:hypothetical protein n=1 Tax=Fontimonas sp. SYSU GA230001 TaxID=3142450 RepID=UPI0032B497FC